MTTKNEQSTQTDLSEEERGRLEQWEPPWLNLPLHKVVEHQIQLGVKGVEHTVIYGPRGLGKTATVRRIIDRLEREVLERALSDEDGSAAGSVVKPIHYYASGRADGRQTALRDLLREVGPPGIGPRRPGAWSDRDYARRIVEEIQRAGTCLICIDEAQKIDPHNLDTLCEVGDEAEDQEWPFGLVLIGNPPLRTNLRETGQLGQRFSGKVEFRPFKVQEVASHLTSFHPHLEKLEASLESKEWARLSRRLLDQSRRSFRRLVRIIVNANELALSLNREIDVKILKDAINKMAAER